jgi:hypothetical protein
VGAEGAGVEGTGVAGIFGFVAVLLLGATLGRLVVSGAAGASMLRWVAKNSSSQLKNISLSSGERLAQSISSTAALRRGATTGGVFTDRLRDGGGDGKGAARWTSSLCTATMAGLNALDGVDGGLPRPKLGAGGAGGGSGRESSYKSSASG